jgi:transcription elongation GreA/GreB family factor
VADSYAGKKILRCQDGSDGVTFGGVHDGRLEGLSHSPTSPFSCLGPWRLYRRAMEKTSLVVQLAAKLKAAADQSLRFAEDARVEAKTGAPRAVNLAAATRERLEAAQAACQAIGDFDPRPLKKGERIGLGAVVEVEDGEGGKTLFVAPAGAGEELTGPDGDGFLHVVTPGSPFGRALMGKRVGDVIEVMVAGELTEWEIVFTG